MYRYKTVIDQDSLSEVMPVMFQKTRRTIALVVACELVLGIGMAYYMSRSSYSAVATFCIYAAVAVAIAVVIVVTARKKYKKAVERSIQQNLDKVREQYHSDRCVKTWRLKDDQVIPESGKENTLALEDLLSITETDNYIVASFKGKVVQMIRKSSIEGGNEAELADYLRKQIHK